MNNLTVDFKKGSSDDSPAASKATDLEKRATAIQRICQQLDESTITFDASNVWEDIKQYYNEYHRWLYSTISNYLFSAKETGRFHTNLDLLTAFAEHKANEADEESLEHNILIMVLKLWDHVLLAEKQAERFSEEDADYKAKFDKYFIPQMYVFSNEINMRLISLIGIFTALSFLVFGGISALDNIFQGAATIPILQISIIGSIWGLAILNLVFFFIFFVSKLTNRSISATTNVDATISERYPIWVWSNYLLVLILAATAWLYYIDYANAGGWLVDISHEYPIQFTLITFVAIVITFFVCGCILHKKSTHKKTKVSGVRRYSIKRQSVIKLALLGISIAVCVGFLIICFAYRNAVNEFLLANPLVFAFVVTLIITIILSDKLLDILNELFSTPTDQPEIIKKTSVSSSEEPSDTRPEH